MSTVIINTPYEIMEVCGNITGGQHSADGLTPQDPYEFETTDVFIDGKLQSGLCKESIDTIIHPFFDGSENYEIVINEIEREFINNPK